MDYHKLVLTDDLLSNGIQKVDVALTFVGGIIGSVVGGIFAIVKYSSKTGLNRNSNSCNDGANVSAEGETFGTSVELEGSFLWS
ncbi:hypothetical protein Tco_0864675 [Tanacetum coccineum]